MAEQVQLGFGSILGRQKALNHLQSRKSDLRDERFGKPSASGRERMIACPGSVQRNATRQVYLPVKRPSTARCGTKDWREFPGHSKRSARTRTFRGSYPLMIRESLRGQDFFWRYRGRNSLGAPSDPVRALGRTNFFGAMGFTDLGSN
jgi:hypothetical protein